MKRILCIWLGIVILLSGCAASQTAPQSASSANRLPELSTWAYFEGTASDSDAAFDADTPISAYSDAEEAALGETGTAKASAPVPTGSDTDASAEPLLYTVFPCQSETESYSEDGTQIYVGKIYDAYASFQDPAVNQWLSQQLQEINQQSQRYQDAQVQEAAELYQQLTDEGYTASFYPYSFYATPSTERMDADVLSLLMLNSWYRGGAHPSYTQTSYNFDLRAQRRLEMDDILLPGARERLLQLVLDTMEAKINALNNTVSAYMLFSGYQDIITASITGDTPTENWYFSEKGLVLYYTPYEAFEIAPYAAGIISVELPYESLEDVLRPEYQPLRQDAADGGEEAAGTLLVADSDEAEASGMLLSFQSAEDTDNWSTRLETDGIIYHLQIYSVSSWLEDTPILGNMVFSANRMTGEDSLRIITGIPSGGSYFIRYSNAAGETLCCSLSQDGMRVLPPQYSNLPEEN